jgi:acetyl esterase/lipase
MFTTVNDPNADMSISPAPFATVAFNPVFDSNLPDGYGTNVFDDPKASSPIDHVVADLPPLIIMHGTKDSTIFIERVRALRDAMPAAGNKVTLHEYPGAGHGFFNIENSKNQYNTDTLIQVDDFLRALDLLPFDSSK